MKNIGVYIHIPFCDRICNYCDFTTFQGANNKIDDYIKALLTEIKLKGNKEYVVDSIFIGGGTPSLIDGKYIYEILETLRNSYTVMNNIEISIETNPKTFDYVKLKIYKDSGINRISVGVQSFDDNILTELGRNHNVFDVYNSIDLLKKFDFDINLDLIFGYEKQSFNIIENDLDEISKISPEHISYYSLIIEKGTKFSSLMDSGALKFPDEDEERKMYHYICDKLNSLNINQYEISNFAKNGKQSIHNKKYWNCKEYLGFGLASHSYIDRKRFSNTKNIVKYIKQLSNNQIPEDFSEILDLNMMKFEYVIMNMRLLNGFLIEDFNNRFNADFIKENEKAVSTSLNSGIIKIDDGRIFFTKKGLDITDNFFVKINY